MAKKRSVFPFCNYIKFAVTFTKIAL